MSSSHPVPPAAQPEGEQLCSLCGKRRGDHSTQAASCPDPQTDDYWHKKNKFRPAIIHRLTHGEPEGWPDKRMMEQAWERQESAPPLPAEGGTPETDAWEAAFKRAQQQWEKDSKCSGLERWSQARLFWNAAIAHMHKHNIK